MIERDIETVRRFIEAELSQREEGGGRAYVRAAQLAREAFERIASAIEAENRAKQVRDFDEIFGGDNARND